MNSEPIIQIRDLSKSFGPLEVLKGIDLDVPKGECAVVLGGSGSGKSVLIKTIVGLLKADRGTIKLLGERIDLLEGDELDKLRLSIGFLFQSGALFDSMTVSENLMFFLERHLKLPLAEATDRILETLEWVGLPEKLHDYPASLSGGQKKRIALARAVIMEPKILLYDEPTTGLDPVSVRLVADLIARLQAERGLSSIAITHDLLCAEIIADRVHFLHDGRFIKSGSLEEISRFDHPAIVNFFGKEITLSS